VTGGQYEMFGNKRTFDVREGDYTGVRKPSARHVAAVIAYGQSEHPGTKPEAPSYD